MSIDTYSYLTFELAGIVCSFIILCSLKGEATLLNPRLWKVFAALFAVWISWDVIAIRLGVFHFPPSGSLPLRLAGLPVEEYLFFIVHFLITWTLVLAAETSDLESR